MKTLLQYCCIIVLLSITPTLSAQEGTLSSIDKQYYSGLE